MSTNNPENIRSRLTSIIVHTIDERRRYKSLEEITKISGATWRGFWNRNGSASGEMIEAIAKTWPQYAFWLATGATDPQSGHIAPPEANGIVEKENDELPQATEYFRFQINLLDNQPIRRSGGLDLSGLNEHFAVAEIMKGMKTSPAENVNPSVKPGQLDLSVLDDPEWEKDYENAKAILKARRLEDQYAQLAELRRQKIKKLKEKE